MSRALLLIRQNKGDDYAAKKEADLFAYECFIMRQYSVQTPRHVVAEHASGPAALARPILPTGKRARSIAFLGLAFRVNRNCLRQRTRARFYSGRLNHTLITPERSYGLEVYLQKKHTRVTETQKERVAKR